MITGDSRSRSERWHSPHRRLSLRERASFAERKVAFATSSSFAPRKGVLCRLRLREHTCFRGAKGDIQPHRRLSLRERVFFVVFGTANARTFAPRKATFATSSSFAPRKGVLCCLWHRECAVLSLRERARFRGAKYDKKTPRVSIPATLNGNLLLNHAATVSGSQRGEFSGPGISSCIGRRTTDDGQIEIGRVLHDGMDLKRQLPEEYRDG